MSKRNSHSKTLPTVAAKTIVSMVKKDSDIIDSCGMIVKKGIEIVSELYECFPTVFTEEIKPSVFAFSLSIVARKAVKEGTITIPEFMAYYSEHKARIANELQDYGAFGDLLELLVRLAFVPKNLRRASMLAVKSSNHADMISKKIGTAEIGHNGKTWTNATLFDYMEGDFTSVVYGMFSEQDKNDVYNLCACGQYEKAVEYISEYMCVWPNKYDFLHDMDNLSSGRGIALKGENVQSVYNDGKYRQFQNAIENEQFITLSEFLKD